MLQMILRASRVRFFSASILPVLLGTAVGWRATGVLDLPAVVAALVATVLLHSGTNLLNEYFDFRSGNDAANAAFLAGMSGGSRVFLEEGFRARWLLASGAATVTAAAAIGLWLAWRKGAQLLVLILLGAVTSVGYSAPPLAFAYRGLGEMAVGISWLAMAEGAFFLQTGRLSLLPVWIALPVGLPTVHLINEFPDEPADRTTGKRNAVVRLGLRRARVLFLLLIALVFAVLLGDVAAGVLPSSALVALAAAPLAFLAGRQAWAGYDSPAALRSASRTTVLLRQSLALWLMAVEIAAEGNGPLLMVFLAFWLLLLGWGFRTLRGLPRH